MKVSKYTTFFKSDKYGFFIYSSLTNSFMKLNKELFGLLGNSKDNSTLLNKIDKEILLSLRNSKVVVEDNFDENFFTQKQYLSYFVTDQSTK